jgi:2'-5' RNA ligase
MHRLFVALEPPQEVKAVLLALMGGVEDARWQTEAQLHVTILFVGEVDRHQANRVADCLERLEAPAVDVRLAGIGTFDGGRRRWITSIWAGLEPLDALTALHRKVERVLLPAGVPPETRRFQPHVTLARFPARGVPPEALERFLSTTLVRRTGWKADAVTLFESSLGRGGAHYTPILRVPLGRSLTESSADPHQSPA